MSKQFLIIMVNDYQKMQTKMTMYLMWECSISISLNLVSATGEMYPKSLIHCWWNCYLVQPLWKMVWRLAKKFRASIWPTTPSLSIYPKNIKTIPIKKKKTNTHIHAKLCSLPHCCGTYPLYYLSGSATLFTVAKTWKQPKCPTTDKWRIWFLYTIEYNSLWEIILQFAAT